MEKEQEFRISNHTEHFRPHCFGCKKDLDMNQTQAINHAYEFNHHVQLTWNHIWDIQKPITETPEQEREQCDRCRHLGFDCKGDDIDYPQCFTPPIIVSNEDRRKVD